MRRRKVERLAVTKLTGTFEALAIAEPSAESAASARDEEHAVAVRIRAALAKLNPRYGDAVRLRILEERSREHCAAALGVSVATFDVVLLRALRAFRKSWQELPSP
jgi:RNA polymerase sigma-70 factor (ECF subfamily)